jgi:hypothetical protein
MSAFDMFGFIDDTFQSVIPATRTSFPAAAYDANGIWQPGAGVSTTHKICLQSVTAQELQFLNLGGERQHDVRIIFVNDGDLYSIAPSDTWTFETGQGADGNYKTIQLYNQHWINYCEVIVSRNDDQ